MEFRTDLAFGTKVPPWTESLDRVKERAMNSLPRKARLEYLLAKPTSAAAKRPKAINAKSAASSTLLPKATVAVRHRPLPTASYGELDSVLDHLQVREEPPATADERFLHAMHVMEDGAEGERDPVMHRLKLFKQFLMELSHGHDDLEGVLATIVQEFTVVLHKLQTELQLERDGRTGELPSVFATKEELRQKVKQLGITVTQQDQELEKHRQTADRLLQDNQRLRLDNERLGGAVQQLKRILLQAARRMGEVQPEAADSPTGLSLASAAEDQSDASVIPTASFLQVTERLLADYRITKAAQDSLIQQRDDAVSQMERLRAELEDAQRKFDKLASVYETQWKDLDAVTFKMQQMQEDISTYQQTKDFQTLAENQCKFLEHRITLLLRDLHTAVEGNKLYLSRRGIATGHAAAQATAQPEGVTSFLETMAGQAAAGRKRRAGRIGEDPDFFRPLGSGSDVPVYLRTDTAEPIPNLHLSTEDCHKLVRDFLRRRGTVHQDSRVCLHSLLLQQHGEQPLAAGYSFLDCCTRLAPTSAVCWLCIRTLEGTLPEDTYQLMVEEVDKFRAVASAKMVPIGGKVPIGRIAAVLEEAFPTKSLERHVQLRAIALAGADFQETASEAQLQELLAVGYGKSQLMEEVRRQFLLQHDEYLHELQYALCRMDKTMSTHSALSLGDIAMAYKMVDPKISEDEIRRRLLLGVPIAMQKEGKRTGRVDFSYKVRVDEYLRKLGRRCILWRSAAPASPFQGRLLWSDNPGEAPEADDWHAGSEVYDASETSPSAEA
eukprot:EG_transcript_3204